MKRLSAKQRHSLVGSAAYWEIKREFQFHFLMDHGLNVGTRFLDYGCGTLRGGLPIIMVLSPGAYTGVDVRRSVIDEAKQELLANNVFAKDPQLETIAQPEQTPYGPFDIIWIFDTVIHMSDDIVMEVFSACRSRLASGGSLFFNANVGGDEISDMTWREFPVVFRSHYFYESLARDSEFNIEVLGTLKELGHDSGDELQNAQIMFKMTADETV